MMGSGMDMMTAPNLQMSPTKRMMKPHTWTTLRDPTCDEDNTLDLFRPKITENYLKCKSQMEHAKSNFKIFKPPIPVIEWPGGYMVRPKGGPGLQNGGQYISV